ncbi:hypothetical protein GCM10018966_034080 [Streptomyces yanii]
MDILGVARIPDTTSLLATYEVELERNAKSAEKSGAKRAAKSIGGKVKEPLGIGDEAEELAEESRPRRRGAPRRVGERPPARSSSTAEEE